MPAARHRAIARQRLLLIIELEKKRNLRKEFVTHSTHDRPVVCGIRRQKWASPLTK